MAQSELHGTQADMRQANSTIRQVPYKWLQLSARHRKQNRRVATISALHVTLCMPGAVSGSHAACMPWP